MATPDGRLGGESGASGSATLSWETSGTSSALMWAKGQWAPFRQLPLAKKTQGVCARPGLEVPAARGLAAPLDWAAAGGGAGGLAGPGAVAEGGVAPLGPALGWVAGATVAGGTVAAAFVARAVTSVIVVVVGGAGVSASAAIITLLARKPSLLPAKLLLGSPARASSVEALSTGRLSTESI